MSHTPVTRVALALAGAASVVTVPLWANTVPAAATPSAMATSAMPSWAEIQDTEAASNAIAPRNACTEEFARMSARIDSAVTALSETPANTEQGIGSLNEARFAQRDLEHLGCNLTRNPCPQASDTVATELWGGLEALTQQPPNVPDGLKHSRAAQQSAGQMRTSSCVGDA